MNLSHLVLRFYGTNKFFLKRKFLKDKVFTNADSGCLGSNYRRRTRMTAIIVGELSRSFDPAVSEWGNPTNFIVGYPVVKFPI